MLRFAVGLMFLALVAIPALAGCPIGVQQYAAPVRVVQAVKVEPAVVLVPSIVAVPVYGASYNPAPHSLQDKTNVEILEALKNLNQRLGTLEKGKQPDPNPNNFNPFAPQPQPPQAIQAGNLPVSVVNKCAVCHDKSRADDKGAGFVLTEGGKAVAISDKEFRKAMNLVLTQKMPKGGKLTEEELGDVVTWLGGLK